VKERNYLLIDIGTSSIKAAVMSGAGEVFSSVRRRLVDRGSVPGSMRVGRWEEELRQSIPHLVSGYRVDAVVLSGNGPTLVAIDGAGEPMEPVMLWLDDRRRGIGETESFYLPRMRWFLDRPEASRVRQFIPFPEYLAYRLTGEAVAISPSHAFERYIWSEPERERYGVPPEMLPPFVPVGSAIGGVRSDQAERYGLTAGTPVVAAGSDFLMSLVGTNTLQPGRCCDRAGTSEGINFCSDRSIRSEGLRTLPHIREGYFNVAGILASTGLLFEWFREISGQAGRDYGDMMVDILEVSDGTRIPWFFPSEHRGAAWEFQRGMFIGLGAEHNRAMMGRAVVLSIGFAVREAIEYLGHSGCTVEELRACGGQARNGLWTQMKSDICGIPIAVPHVADAELTGNLAVGMRALGEAGSLEEAADRVVRFIHHYEPDSRRSSVYDEQYRQYQERYGRFRTALRECQSE